MIDSWNKFLASLATRGGAIFILLFLTVTVDLGVFIMYLKHDMDFRGLAYVVTSGGLVNALMLALKGSSDSTATTTMTPSGSTTSVATTGEAAAQVTAAKQP